MNKQMLLAALVVIVLVGGGVWFSSLGKKGISTPESSPVSANDENNPVDSTISEFPAATGAIEKIVNKEIDVEIDASNFKYSVPEIKVQQGDIVNVKFSVKEGFHDFVLDEFKAKTKQQGVGSSETIKFIADKTGTFEYYCSIGNHRKMGMVGKLIVE